MPTLPNITTLEQLIPTLKQWQQAMNPVINTPVAPRTPFNFQAVGGAAGATGVTLSWERVSGADGYDLQMSPNGDFSTAVTIASIKNPTATSYFDSTTVTGVTRYYRVRATSGTRSQPQSVKGIWSARVSVTSGSGATTYDTTSASSGNAGWNQPRNPGIGGRTIILQQ